MAFKYDEMIKCMTEYMDSIPKLSAKNPETIKYTMSFLDEEYQVRYGDVPMTVSGEEMINGMAHENDDLWVTYIIHDEEPYYWIVDEKKGSMAGLFREELRDPKTNKVMRAVLNFTHVWLKENDGKLRLWREHLVEVPANIRVDSIEDLK